MFGKKLEANAAKEAQSREEEKQARDKGVVHLSQKGATGRKRSQSTPEADEAHRRAGGGLRHDGARAVPCCAVLCYVVLCCVVLCCVA